MTRLFRNGTRQELVEARGKISGLCERPTKIGAALKAGIDSKVAEMSRTFSALKADFEKELNETRKENAEVERKLRSESMELKAELATKITELRAQIQSERENKTAEIAKLQADLDRMMIWVLDLDGWLYLEETASWYKVWWML
ncbi:unnamed protein product, partial [Mesorhabditis belari]|uniref:Uncharacterized protein n=1 Tax=Mesorhabditis belari TaxID=2138241 RepID=A0AAF3EQG2_9BILA